MTRRVRKRLLDLGSVIPAGADRTPAALGNAREQRNRQVDAGAQAGQLIHTNQDDRRGAGRKFRPLSFAPGMIIFPGIIAGGRRIGVSIGYPGR